MAPVAFDVCWEVGLEGDVVMSIVDHELEEEVVVLEMADGAADDDDDVVVDGPEMEVEAEVVVVLVNVDLEEDDGRDVMENAVKVDVEAVEKAEVIRGNKKMGYQLIPQH
jgi:hypothetical protein